MASVIIEGSSRRTFWPVGVPVKGYETVDIALGKVLLIDGNHDVDHFIDGKITEYIGLHFDRAIFFLWSHARLFLKALLQSLADLFRHGVHQVFHHVARMHDVEVLFDVFLRGGNIGGILLGKAGGASEEGK